MDLEKLLIQMNRLITEYPQHKEGITELYYLCLDEIEGGGSPTHECELAWSDMLDFVSYPSTDE
jgi:hypothetical protein